MDDSELAERKDDPVESGALEPPHEGEREAGGLQQQPAESGALEDEEQPPSAA